MRTNRVPQRWRRHPRWARIALTAATAAVLLSGCADDGPADPVALDVGPLPVPTEEVVLTVVGLVGQPNVGAEVHADIAGIESIGATTHTMFDPFVREELTFTGVRIDTLLAAIGIEPDTKLRWTALDEYEVFFSRGDIAAEDAILATRQDGELIPIEAGGPIRVVFADADGPNGRDSNQWIFNLFRIEAG